LSRHILTVAAVMAASTAVGPAGSSTRPAGSPPAVSAPGGMTHEAAAIARKYLRKFGSKYTARYDPARGIIYISALDEHHLSKTIRLLATFSEAFDKTLKVARPDRLITVLLPTSEDYQPMAPNPKVTGFYDPVDRTVTSVDRGSVLLHEFTHALHQADCERAGQDHPIWIREGLASLFESSLITPAGLQPRVDTRVLTLQKAIRLKQIVPLSRLVAMNNTKFGQNADICYAEARYLMLYLYSKGKLASWYAAYKKGYTEDQTGKRTLEKALGKKLFLVEKDWQQWIRGLQLPWGQRRADRGRLGIHMRDTARGVKIVGFDPGSAAEMAGRLRVGDTVIRFDGRDIRNSAELIGAIRAARALRTVTMVVRRAGRTIEILQPLGQPNTGRPTSG